MKYDLSFFTDLPKAELHCHLDGSLRVDTILELAHEQGISLPHTKKEDLEKFLQIDGTCNSLPEYLKAFEVTNKVLQTTDALERAIFELAEDVWQENVTHIEVRFSPVLHIANGLLLEEVIESVIEGKRRAESNFGIHIGIIVCGIRSMPSSVSLELAKLAVAYKSKGVVAFDIAGPEEGYPATAHKAAFYHIINNNVHTTVHAGEVCGAESIHEAIHYVNANRIGHGTHLFEDKDLFQYVLNQRIPLEMCVTCNVQTQSVSNIENHPIKSYLDQGLRVTLNTDNRLISNTTMSLEFYKVYQAFNLTDNEIKTLVLNSFRSLFLPYDLKKKLLRTTIDRLNLHFDNWA